MFMLLGYRTDLLCLEFLCQLQSLSCVPSCTAIPNKLVSHWHVIILALPALPAYQKEEKLNCYSSEQLEHYSICQVAPESMKEF